MQPSPVSSGGPMIDYNRKLIEKFSDATIDYRFFITDCRGKIKNLLVTNKTIEIDKDVRLISWCKLSFFVDS